MKKTTTTTREYDKDGNLLKETVQTVEEDTKTGWTYPIGGGGGPYPSGPYPHRGYPFYYSGGTCDIPSYSSGG